MPRPLCIHHGTSEPARFFGRERELALLDAALGGGEASVVAFVGPGGQGKTAILQTWLHGFPQYRQADGVFLWSFYRGKDVDLCLRSLLAYARGDGSLPEVSASYCVDHLLPILTTERWALLLDGTEVVQHESGPWRGRFLHPELGRLLEELASQPIPGVVVLTTRFSLPTLTGRRHAILVRLDALDDASACHLLTSLGVQGERDTLIAAARSCGDHAKAVELLGTWLTQFHAGRAEQFVHLPELPPDPEASPEEAAVARVLAGWQRDLPEELADVVALAAAFRQPPTEQCLLEYLRSESLRHLLHDIWKRTYPPFVERGPEQLTRLVDSLVHWRLLERVSGGTEPGRVSAGAPGGVSAGSFAALTQPRSAGGVSVGAPGGVSAGRTLVIDAHPLVRRGFENRLGPAGRQHTARTRAGFLRGRPDRRPPDTLAEAQEEVELFHAYCEAGMWNEADSVFVALDNPKYRFLAPAFERDLLLRFFPEGDWRQPPLWPGFGRYRSLAICQEMLGDFRAAIETYPPADAPLRGDALIALGELGSLLDTPTVPPPWQTLWSAYRCHALALSGRDAEAVALAGSLMPVDVYEWVHVFECLLRTGQLNLLDLRSVLYRPPLASEHRWSQLARERMRLDYLSVMEPAANLEEGYRALMEAYDQGGLAWERCLVRLRLGRWLLRRGETSQARELAVTARTIANRTGMRLVEADARALLEGLDGELMITPN